MTAELDRIDSLIKSRIAQNRLARRDALRLGGERFELMRLGDGADKQEVDYRRQSWSVGELLAFYDRQFVQHAYLVLLKRDADIEGLNSRLRMLHSGQTSRVELLFRLRYGAEGKQHKTAVKGLLRAFLIERLCQLPVLGVVPRYLRALIYLPRIQRDIEELRGLIAMNKNDLEYKDQAIIELQNEHLAKIIRHLNP